MPKVIDVRPKDVYATVEFSIAELAKLRKALDLSTINYDGKTPEEKEAVEYLQDVFYPFIDHFLEDMKHGT